MTILENKMREEINQSAKDFSYIFWRFLPITIIILVVLSMFGFALKSAGLIGSTIVEREVFKNSFQYKEGMNQRAAILKANISEIDIRLRSNPENKEELLNQRMILLSQLKAITINE